MIRIVGLQTIYHIRIIYGNLNLRIAHDGGPRWWNEFGCYIQHQFVRPRPKNQPIGCSIYRVQSTTKFGHSKSGAFKDLMYSKNKMYNCQSNQNQMRVYTTQQPVAGSNHGKNVLLLILIKYSTIKCYNTLHFLLVLNF